MKSLLRALSVVLVTFGFAALAAAQTAPTGAAPPKPNEGPIYAIGFYEVVPAAAPQVAGILKTYRDATRKEPGATRIDAYQEAAMPSRAISYEIWRDEAAYEAHAKGAAVTMLNNALKVYQEGPPDIRTHFAVFTAAAPQAPAVAATTIVVSHLDVPPGSLDMTLPLLVPLEKGSAGDVGMVRYQILEQVNPHANHFRLVEEWTHEMDFTAHNMSPHVRAFRTAVAPYLGTPYDQRLYNLIN